MDKPAWLDVGARIEVRWEIAEASGEPQRCYSATCIAQGGCAPGCFSAIGRRASGSEPQSTTVWWPATVHRRDGIHTLTDDETGETAVLPVYVLRYDADGDVGWDEQEECWSCFVGFHRVLDVKYGESCLYYRKEGESWEPDELESLMDAVGGEDPVELASADAPGPVPPEGSAQRGSESDTAAAAPDTDDAWLSAGTSDARTAAERLADSLLGSLRQQYEQMSQTVAYEVQVRAAERLGQLRERFVSALHSKFREGAPLTVEMARAVIAEIQAGQEHPSKRLRTA